MGAAGAFMGGLGSLMGGNSKSSGSTTASSDGSSQNSSVNASQSNSNQQSSNASGSANQAYGALNQALNPSLGYVGSAGNMIGALLGLPVSNTPYTAQAPAPHVLPHVALSPSPAPGSGTGSSMIDTLLSQYLASQASASPTPTPVPSPVPGPVSNPIVAPTPTVPTSGGGTSMGERRGTQYRAMGGPVQAGKPYVVGENQAEVFVPHTNGTIFPNAPAPGQMPLNPGGGGQQYPLGGRLDMSSLIGRFQNGGGGGHGHGGPIMTPGGGGGGGPIPGIPAPTPPVAGGVAPATDPNAALNTFANSAGENFILDQGQKAISGASASNGTFDSGATGKALTQYGQNLGSTYLNDYMNHLFDYAKLGLGSASALSGAGGVSQSIGNSSGGANSSSFGTSSGSSNQTSDSSSTQKSKSKQGLGI